MDFSTLETCLTQRLQVLVLTCLLVSLDGDGKDRWQVERKLLDCSSSMILLDPLTSHPQVHRLNVKPSRGPSWRPDLSSTCPLLKKGSLMGKRTLWVAMRTTGRLLLGGEKKKKWSWLSGEYDGSLQRVTKHPPFGPHWCITGHRPVLPGDPWPPLGS